MRPLTVIPSLKKDENKPVSLVQCQCLHEFEASTESTKAVCTGCGQELDWGLRK